MKSNYKIFLCLSILCIAVFTACSKKDCCEVIGSEGSPLSHIILSVKDAEGHDLLNPNTPNSIKESSISLEHIYSGGTEKVAYDEKSNRIKIVKHPHLQDLYVLALQTNMRIDDNGKHTTIIKWNDKEEDVMQAEYSHDLSKVKSISFNNTLIWNDKGASSLPPTIIK